MVVLKGELSVVLETTASNHNELDASTQQKVPSCSDDIHSEVGMPSLNPFVVLPLPLRNSTEVPRKSSSNATLEQTPQFGDYMSNEELGKMSSLNKRLNLRSTLEIAVIDEDANLESEREIPSLSSENGKEATE